MVEHTRLIAGIKYLKLHNPNEFKSKSIEDNVYFTLRDIFLNYGDIDDIMRANYFNNLLTNDICFEDRNENFTYSNKLMEKTYLMHLIEFFKSIKQTGFEFETPEQYWREDKNTIEYNDELKWYYDVDMNKYIELNIWMKQFKNLISQLETRLEKLNKL